MVEFLGIASIVVFSINIFYYRIVKIYKSLANNNVQYYLENKQIHRLHCTLGVISIILAIVHIPDIFNNIEFNSGYMSLLILFLLNMSGFLEKYCNNIDFIKKYWKSIHYVLVIGFILVTIHHVIVEYS